MAFVIFNQILKEHSVSNSGDPDQMPRPVASDLGLYCLPMSHKKEGSLIWDQRVWTTHPPDAIHVF